MQALLTIPYKCTMKTISPTILLLFLSTHHSLYADTQELDLTTVSAALQSLEVSPESSLETIRKIPGGSSVIDARDWESQILKPEDIFRFDPGVYARSNGTANDTRLSIRGSGIQRRFGSRGISLLLDGIPANDADGSYYTRIIDPESISHIETFRGGNGLSHGATQLGGAIQIHQKNGTTHAGTRASAEYGSFNTLRFHFEHGGRQEKWDWFLGYSLISSDGYRDRQDSDSDHVTLNLGYHWSDSAVTRFHGLFNNSQGLLSGSLTPDEFSADPRQSEPGRNPATDRDLITIRLGQNTSWETASGTWNFYTNYQYLDFDHLTGLGPFRFNNLIDFDIDSVSAGFNGTFHHQLANLEHTTKFTSSAEYGRNLVGGFSGFVTPFSPPAGINDREDISTNWKLYLENDTTIAQNHHIIAGVGYIWTERRRLIGSDNTSSTSESFTNRQEGYLGKIGYLYKPSLNTQIFANASLSFEAAPFSESNEANITDPQQAITYEIGARHQSPTIQAEIAVYLAQVRDEFVFEETATSSGIFNVTNADTTHFGIEAAATIHLNELLKLDGGLLYSIDTSYQYNDFTFDEGPAEGNQIPVISEHVIATKFRVEGERWSSAITIDWLPSGLFADNNNTLETDGYATVELSASYQINDSLTCYGGIKNLFDEDFVSTVTVNPSSDRFINPGDGRSLYAGLRYQW